MTKEFWRVLEKLARESRIVIDRPKGSRHPRYPEFVYPLDYGYLENTSSMDGEGIDVYIGSREDGALDAVLVTVDAVKRDSEIKLLLGLTEAEKETVMGFHNASDLMKAILVRREEDV